MTCSTDPASIAVFLPDRREMLPLVRKVLDLKNIDWFSLTMNALDLRSLENGIQELDAPDYSMVMPKGG